MNKILFRISAWIMYYIYLKWILNYISDKQA